MDIDNRDIIGPFWTSNWQTETWFLCLWPEEIIAVRLSKKEHNKLSFGLGGNFEAELRKRWISREFDIAALPPESYRIFSSDFIENIEVVWSYWRNRVDIQSDGDKCRYQIIHREQTEEFVTILRAYFDSRVQAIDKPKSLLARILMS